MPAARDRVEGLLWTRSGERRLPATRSLDRAVERLPRGALFELCELDPRGPVWFLPTRGPRSRAGEAPRRLARGEGAGGGGGRWIPLFGASPAGASVTRRRHRLRRVGGPAGQVNARERRELLGVEVPGVRPGPSVLKLDAIAAVRRFRPDVVLACWLPPGRLLERLIRAPVRYVLEIGARGGITPGAWNWRFAHEFCEDLERHARCRLDERPRRALHSTVTLYYGARHPEHATERVRPGDWLWQFRPA